MATASQINFDDASSLKNLSRNECATIAEDTLKILQDGFYHVRGGQRIDIADDLQYSLENTLLYKEDDVHKQKRIISSTETTDSESSTPDAPISTKFYVQHCTTLQAAQALATQFGEDTVGVLNFASAKNPGGGFLRGSKAQEESLARSSSLYLSLTKDHIFNDFYEYNRHGKNAVYSNRLIYTPRVTIFKNDNGNLLKSPYHVGMVTCPAPNAGVARDPAAVREAMIERIRRILIVFQNYKHTSLVLGAFGCGVFKNNPFEVAVLFRQFLESPQFKYSFQHVVFAVLDEQMCQVFDQVFSAPKMIHLQDQLTRLTPVERPNTRNQKRTRQKRKETHRVYRDFEETEF